MAAITFRLEHVCGDKLLVFEAQDVCDYEHHLRTYHDMTFKGVTQYVRLQSTKAFKDAGGYKAIREPKP